MPRLAGRGDDGHLALTFDDGPDPCSTPQILDALDEVGWKATFFMLGSMAAASPGVAREVAERGHEIALHGGTHHYHPIRRPRWVADDLKRGLEQVTQATGIRPRWLRPPYGVPSGATFLNASSLGLEVVLWDAWGRDWRAEATAQSVVHDLLRGTRPGATLLLHDSDCTSAHGSWKSTVAALPILAQRIQDMGMAVGPLGEHGIRARKWAAVTQRALGAGPAGGPAVPTR